MKSPAKMLLLVMVVMMASFPPPGLAADGVKLIKGQTLYVPVATSYMRGDYSFDIKASLSLRNTDPHHAISIVKMDFYDTSGKLVEKYLQQPLKLNPAAAINIHVKNPLSGVEGTAPHFVIQWQAETKVVEPIIIGVMFGSAGTRGYSLTTEPRIVSETAD